MVENGGHSMFFGQIFRVRPSKVMTFFCMSNQEVCEKKVLYIGSNFQAKAFRPPLPPYYMQYGIPTISVGNSHFQLSTFGYLNKISSADGA
jgi:hypothetical protein